MALNGLVSGLTPRRATSSPRQRIAIRPSRASLTDPRASSGLDGLIGGREGFTSMRNPREGERCAELGRSSRLPGSLRIPPTLKLRPARDRRKGLPINSARSNPRAGVEGVAALHGAALQPVLKPALALLGGAV